MRVTSIQSTGVPAGLLRVRESAPARKEQGPVVKLPLSTREVCRLTLITPSLNRSEMILEAIQSVLDQDVEGVEHIIVDGGSTDGTLEALAAFPHLRVICQSDGGPYEAFNTGIATARGEIIGFLNTDDVLLPGALRSVLAAFDRHPEADCVCGGAEIRILNPHGTSGKVIRLDTPQMKRLRWNDLISGQTLTNARFFRKEVFRDIGVFDERYPIFADRLFLANFLSHNRLSVAIDAVVYQYRAHDGSLTFSRSRHGPEFFEEALALAREQLFAPIARKSMKNYVRWHSWLAGLVIWKFLRQGAGGKAWRYLWRETRINPLWPAHFFRHLLWHFATRRDRCSYSQATG